MTSQFTSTKMIAVTFALTCATLAAERARAASVLTLSNTGGGAPFFGVLNSPNNVIDDPFAYDPSNPTSTSPDQSDGDQGFQSGFLTQNNDANNFWFSQVATGGLSLDFLDIWGRDDYAGAEQSRHQDLVFSFYTSTNATSGLLATSASFNGVTPSPSSYGRFDVTSLIANAATRSTIQSVRIDHSPSNTDFLFPMEVRAGSFQNALATPEPSTLILVVFGLAGAARTRRSRRKRA